MPGMVPTDLVGCVIVVATVVMTIIVGRMMVGLGMRSMVMAAVSIAG